MISVIVALVFLAIVFGFCVCGYGLEKAREEIAEQGIKIHRIRNALFDKYGTGIFEYTRDSADKQEIMQPADLISIPKMNRENIELLMDYFKLIKKCTSKEVITKEGKIELLKKPPEKKTRKIPPRIW